MYTPPSARASAAAYRQVGVDSQVLSASPHGLIGLLFNELLACLQGAASAIERADVTSKVRLMAKASRLIDEGLMSSLDVKAGGEVAANLQQLYAYCLLHLAQANAANDAAQVRAVQALLEPVIDGWRQIGGRA